MTPRVKYKISLDSINNVLAEDQRVNSVLIFFIIASVQIVFSTNYLYQAQKFKIIYTVGDVSSVKSENRILWKICQPCDDQAHNLIVIGIQL